MPPELLDFQRGFAAAIAAPAAGAMAVYRNTVLHGAVEALRANYPVVEQIVGAEMFAAVAADHAAAYPPADPVLALYGSDFADWLREQRWIEDLPYLPDVAAIERLHVEVLMAADAAPLTAAQVDAAGDLTRLVIRLHPAVRFAWFTTPAMSIWLAHQRPLTQPFAPEWKAEGALFARPSPFVLHTPRIGRAAHRILAGIRIGEAAGASIAAAARLYPEEDAAALFAALVKLGLFTTDLERDLP